MKNRGGMKAFRFPCSFSDFSSDRHYWDREVDMDLSLYTGIQLTIFCPDVSSISLFYLYLKSGPGWYSIHFYPQTEGNWHRVTIMKSRMGIEGIPEGFHTIEKIRLAVYPCDSRDTDFYISEINYIIDTSPVAVIRNESVYANDPDGSGKSSAVIEYTENTWKMLDAIGLPCNVYSDTRLTYEQVKRKKVLILPYNPAMSDASVRVIEKFLNNGGNLICFYILPPQLQKVCGINVGSFVKEKYPGFFQTIHFDKKELDYDKTELDGIPETIRQASWNIFAPESVPGKSKTIGTWYTINGENTGYAAGSVSTNCIYFSHVLLQDDLPGKKLLLGTMVGHFLSGLPRPDESAYGEEENTPHSFRKEFFNNTDAFEFKGIWCHSPFGIPGLTWKQAIRGLKKQHITALFPHMAAGGIAYYKSRVLPQHSSINEKGDQIEACLSACREYGIECHIWKICFKLGADVPNTFLSALKKEKRLQISSTGNPGEKWLCPSHPANKQLEIQSMCEIVEQYDVDGIHLDYIRYPSSQYCFCNKCRKRFEQYVGKTFKTWPGEVLSDQTILALWREFKRENITEIVKQVSEKARQIRPDIKVSAAVFPNLQLDRERVSQDWGLWCLKGYCDFICPMNYTDSVLLFKVLTTQQLRRAGDVPCYPGIGVSVWDTPYNSEKLYDQADVLKNANTNGYVLFEYDRELYTRYFVE